MPFRDKHEVAKLAKQFSDFMSGWDTASTTMRRYQNKILGQMTRHLEWFCDPRASVAAQAVASEHGIDLLQCKGYLEHARRLQTLGIYWEHIEPAKQLTNRLIAARHSLREIEKIIVTADVAWILKTENDGLPTTHRPDPRACYRQAGIEIDWN